jgi:hypothetical protein
LKISGYGNCGDAENPLANRCEQLCLDEGAATYHDPAIASKPLAGLSS